MLENAEGTVVGGFYGATYWQWLEIVALWVQPELRGRGYARELVLLGEKEAARRGCRGAFVDTFSFQARGFYEKLDYTVFGVLPNFPAQHERFYLRKIWGLTDEAAPAEGGF
nr:GNAT family N-acetyltransferase [Acanthopleuribacter pedis]